MGGAYRTTAHALVTVRLILCNKQSGALSDSLWLSDGERKERRTTGTTARWGRVRKTRPYWRRLS
ncbi:MAG: hypothetical protein KGS09_21155, partial [Nitrospirae bacterium]|nr:hypothetical protein [Nitrospirota bacterium]